jgi:hypothetical protein
MTSDPLPYDESWWYPQMPGEMVIPRNFRMASDIAKLTNRSLPLEFTFYDFVENEILVVEPIDSLHLVQITVESRDGSHYITTAIDLEMWLHLKHNLVYLGLI